MANWPMGNYDTDIGDLVDGVYISPTRIILLSSVSMGLYWLYWMYRTWKQYHDHTGAAAYPVWHGLTQLVPIYGFFRFHAHIRTYRELMQGRGVPDNLNLATLTAIVVINTIVGFSAGGLNNSDLVSLGMRLVMFVVQLATVAVAIGVMCRVQSNLNRYWDDVDNRLMQSARFGKGEIVCIVLGILVWLGTIAGIIWPS